MSDHWLVTVMHTFHSIQKFPLAKISEKLVELTDILAKN